MSRIAATFEALKKQKKKALIPFVTAGDPTPALTVALMHSLVDGGADLLELGVPFSDPMADGPVIQRSSERALKQGVSLKDVIGFVREFRSTNTSTPVVLMGYANPVEAMGLERFADAAGAAGVDGVLVVDYPPGEAQRLVELLDAHGLDTIFLLSPTTTDARLEEVKRVGRGYLYYVSLRGVTGASNIDLADVAARKSACRRRRPCRWASASAFAIRRRRRPSRRLRMRWWSAAGWCRKWKVRSRVRLWKGSRH